MLKNFHFDENQPKNQSKNPSDDQPEKIQPRPSDRERRALKLAEEMIQYDSRKQMSRADVIIRNKFVYKKILKCLTHITRVLVTLTADQSDEPQILRDVTQRSD
jgi:dephospho-CoA kinase